MKIIGITACTAGIAHTYIVAEKIQQAELKLVMSAKLKHKEQLVHKMN